MDVVEAADRLRAGLADYGENFSIAFYAVPHGLRMLADDPPTWAIDVRATRCRLSFDYGDKRMKIDHTATSLTVLVEDVMSTVRGNLRLPRPHRTA